MNKLGNSTLLISLRYVSGGFRCDMEVNHRFIVRFKSPTDILAFFANMSQLPTDN